MQRTTTDRITRESALPTYKTMLRGAFIDRQGVEQHFVYQVTEEPCVLAGDVEILRPAVEKMFASRGAELLTLQMVVENTERVDLDELLGRTDDPVAKVVQLFRS